MSTTYRTVLGDTFESVARKVYGTDTEAARIKAANPGIAALIAGTVLNIPVRGGAPTDLPTELPSDRPDEVALRINGQRFRFWPGMQITRSVDSIDSVTFRAPFEYEAPGFRETFRPFTYPTIDVSIDGVPLFTGTLVTVTPMVSATARAIEVSGYGRPGVLNDCMPPASAFPLEFNGATLKVIAEKLCFPFGVAVDFAGSPGAAFKRVACDPGQKVLPFLAGLAQQRALVISSTEVGALRFAQSTTTGVPVVVLVQGQSPLMSVSPAFQAQEYYSDVTGLEMVRAGRTGSKYTARNSRLSGVVRPYNFRVADSTSGDVRTATESKLARMFASMASYSVQVDTWRDPTGALWAPNTLVSLEAPDAMVYNPYTFLVRTVTFERSDTVTTATLNLVMPGAFAGRIPDVLPWD